MNNLKPWYTSWTIWFNVIFALVTFISSLSAFIPFPPEVIVIIGTVANILLRFKTDSSITTPNAIPDTTPHS